MKKVLLVLVGLLIGGALAVQAGPSTLGMSVQYNWLNGFLVTKATQTIAAGGIITDNACGGPKYVTAAGAVSTDTTNAITAPSVANKGCSMEVCNVGANTITIKHSTNTKTSTGSDLALAQHGCVSYASTGTYWYQTSAMVTNS